MHRSVFLWMIGLCCLAACVRVDDSPTSENPPSRLAPLPTIAPSPTAAYPWSDENLVMSGLCFEAALALAGQVFVFRSPEEHIQFYEQADQRDLCRHTVVRYPFEFSAERVLVGLWSFGRGCTARHEVISIERDDAAQSLRIRLRFVTEGSCDYELVQPFWIGLEGVSGYSINLEVE